MTLKEATVEREIRDESPSMAVVSAVAAATNTDPTEIEPLYESIDPDALDYLVRGGSRSRRGFDGCVSFTVAGCSVVVHGDRKVVAKPAKRR
jgi:hypothetical protein